MKKAISLRIIAVSAVALILSGIVSGLILRKTYENQLEDEAYTMLKIAAIAAKTESDSNRAAKLLSEQYDNYRITIIAQDGTVLGDSHADVKTLENHADRPEVKDALRFGRGSSIRQSDTLGIGMMYAAYRMSDGVILRASVPIQTVRDIVEKQIPALAAGIIIAILAAVLLAGRLSKSVLRPLKNLSEGIRRVENGDYSARLEPASYDELSTLTRSVNSMVQSIESHVKNLNAQKQKLGFLLGSIRQGLVVVDSEQNIVHVNRSAEMIFEAGQDLTGQPFICLTRNMRILSALENCLKTSGSAIFEINNETAGRIYSVSINPLENEWLRGGAVIILTDVTQNAQAEQIRREFVSNASHELKTPVTAIRGFAELLSAGLVTDPGVTKDYLERIKSESDRITNIIDDILKLSALDEGKELHSREDVELLPLAEETVLDLRPQAEKKQVTVRVSGQGCTVHAERSDMRQLLTNLIDNAIKYNVPGGEVEVTVDPLPKGGIIRVRDSGIGIPEKDIPRVFERFYRVDKGRSRMVGGTGLGLSIVKHTAAKYGAEIELKSRIGSGSEFTIRFI